MVLDNQRKLDIIRYYNEKKTTRWIAAQVHVSLRDISDTTKEYEQAKQLLVATGDLSDTSSRSKLPRATIVDAFKQFEKEPSLVKILIHLKLEDPDLLRKWLADYIDLKGKGKALELYEKLGSPKILAIADSIAKREEKGISDDEYLEGLKVERDAIALRKEVQELKNEKVVFEKELPPMRQESFVLTTEVPRLREEKSTLLKRIAELEDYEANISNLIWNIEQGAGHQLALKFIEKVAGDLLSSTIFGDRALIAVRNAIEQDPERMKLLMPYSSDSPYSGVEGNFSEALEPLARKVADEINDNEAKSIGREALVAASRNIRKHIRQP